MTMQIFDIYTTYKNLVNEAEQHIQLPTLNIGDDEKQKIISPFAKEDYSAWLLFDNKKNRYLLRNYLNKFSATKKLNFSKDYEIDKFEDILCSSYVSIFKIDKKDDNYSLKDLLTKDEFDIIYTPILEKLTSSYASLRVVKVDDVFLTLNVVNNIEEFLAIPLSEELLGFINSKTHANNTRDHIIKTLKEFLPDILAICYIVNSNIEKDSIAYQKANALYVLSEAFNPSDFELFNFFIENYNFKGAENIETLPNILLFSFADLYVYYLKPRSLSFKNYNIDYSDIIEEQCSEGYYVTKESLKIHINALYGFYTLLKDNSKNVDFILKSLEKTKNNIFKYHNLLNSSVSGFYIDQDIYNCLVESNFTDENSFLEDYEAFLDYIDYYYVTVLTSGDISPKLLKDLSSELEIIPTKDVKTVKNHHFPLLQLFINFSLEKGIIEKENFDDMSYLTPTDIVEKYLISPIEVKMTFWIQAILNEEFSNKTFKNDANKYSDFIVDFITNLNLNKRIEKIDIKKEFLPLVDILIRAGIIKKDRFYKLTNLGKNLYNLFSKTKKKDNIIRVDFSN